MTQDVLNELLDENDLSGDSAVERITATWTVQSIESEETETDNGTGRRVSIEFESDDWNYPITLRFFTSYTSKNGKSTEWVQRSRGQLKNVLKAATGQVNLTDAMDSSSEHYLVGKQVIATTKDNGDGFASLGRFKRVA
jgi:hypothetical protein